MNGNYIREATQEDLQEIISIWKEGVSAQSASMPFELINDADLTLIFSNQIKNQNENFKFWICKNQDNQLLGWQSILPLHASPNLLVSNSFAQSSTYVSIKHKAKGIGKKLLLHSLNYCTEYTTIKHIIGLVLTENGISIKLCKKVGFANMGTLPKAKNADFPRWELVVFEA